MKAIVYATMSVDEDGFDRTDGPVDPINASVVPQGCFILIEPLKRLQYRGVKPGTKIKITIETIPSKKKRKNL